MLKTRYLEFLSNLYEIRSLSMTAERMYLSQPALSEMLKTIENEIDITLFHRTSKGVVPTAFCEEIMPLINNALYLLQQIDQTCLEKKLEQVVKQYQHFITIHSTSVLISFFFLDTFLSLEGNNFANHIDIQEYVDDKTVYNAFLQNRVTNNYYLLIMKNTDIPLIPKDAIVKNICEIQIAANVSQHTAIYQKNSISINDLANIPFIHDLNYVSIFNDYFDYLNQLDVRLDEVFSTRDRLRAINYLTTHNSWLLSFLIDGAPLKQKRFTARQGVKTIKIEDNNLIQYSIVLIVMNSTDSDFETLFYDRLCQEIK